MPELSEIDTILRPWVKLEADALNGTELPWSVGGMYLHQRVPSIATVCARDWGGDLLEIGCLRGGMTVKLAEIARKYGRRVIAVDPWEIGTQNCVGGEYEDFLNTIKPYKDIVDIVRLSSSDPEAIEYIRSRDLCFSYVDGLHSYEACYLDTQTCLHSKCIAVDDTGWAPELLRAVMDAVGIRTILNIVPLHEAYVI